MTKNDDIRYHFRMQNSRTIKIACASGFWGDSPLAVKQLLGASEIDYIVFDYLSEVTMTILAKMRRREPEKGYVQDFLSDVIEPHLEEILRRKIKLIANAGGLNPLGLKLAIENIAAKKNLPVTVVAIDGDEVTGLDGIREKKYVSANAYLGAVPVWEALERGADVVVTGRIVDSALVSGPVLYEFNPELTNYDFLAQASLAGHLIECGTQCCGGNFTDWESVPHPENVGFPIVHFRADGSFELTKPDATGGLVNFGSVAEQLVYEIADPKNYYLPDVICDFSEVTIRESRKDSVEVTGARGRAPSGQYKVCATITEGWKIHTTAFIRGSEAVKKGRSIGEAILKKCEAALAEKYAESLVEVLGGPEEVLLRLSAAHPNIDALEVLAKEIAPGSTSLAPGMTNLLGGRATPMPRIRLETFLVDKNLVTPRLHGGKTPQKKTPSTVTSLQHVPNKAQELYQGKLIKIPLSRIAFARSGDKGADVNVGVIARQHLYYENLKHILSTEIIGQHFRDSFSGQPEVLRWELPGIYGLNFLLKDSLGGGGAYSLRVDPQGKAYGQRLLELMIDFPEELLT